MGDVCVRSAGHELVRAARPDTVRRETPAPVIDVVPVSPLIATDGYPVVSAGDTTKASDAGHRTRRPAAALCERICCQRARLGQTLLTH